MRFLPLGLFLIACGCFLMGSSACTIGSGDSLSMLLPFAGGGMTLLGYLACSPALRRAKQEWRATQAHHAAARKP